MSTVDVAIVLGPNTPPTLSVQIVKWMSDPDLAMRLEAAAAALIQLLLVIGSLILWRGGEIVVGILGAKWVMRGTRSFGDNALRVVGLGAGVLVCTGVLLGLVSLGVWSVAGLWSYPDVLPDSLFARSWSRHWGNIFDTGITTLLIALCATFIAVLLTLGCLEAEYRFNFTMSERGVFLLYLPLMVPQTAFLPGLQTLMLSTGLKGGFVPVVLAHLVFVLPYVFLSLSDPFRAWDVRFGTIAAALGRSANGVLWRVRLPMLLAPVLTAVAVGFAASVGQYLPTLLVGGGRLSTLTTEAVALAAGGDRRAIGVYGLAQTVAAILPFAAALLLPQIIWRNRRGLSDA
jgi:putative thiamine transport system permease protein